MPIADWRDSADSFSDEHLLQQRMAARTVMEQLELSDMPDADVSLLDEDLMWAESRAALSTYGLFLVNEGLWRGQNCRHIIASWESRRLKYQGRRKPLVYPSWFGDDAVHNSHQDYLRTMDPYYADVFEQHGTTRPIFPRGMP